MSLAELFYVKHPRRAASIKPRYVKLRRRRRHGALTLNGDGSFTYTPAADFTGNDSFTYRASDGTASSDLATVELTVGAVTATITGTPAADTVLISESQGVLEVTVNGKTETFEGIERLDVLLLAGDDRLRLEALTTAVFIGAGDGNDDIQASPATAANLTQLGGNPNRDIRILWA